MNFLTELNEQAEKVFNELILAKRAVKEFDEGPLSSPTAAYHKGRAEELEKWYNSLENMIEKVLERSAADLKRHRAELEKILNEREGAK